MERVYFELKAKVMRAAFAPGERLDPAQLARNLGVSPTPVRDALHRLSGERLIETWHQEGCQHREMGREGALGACTSAPVESPPGSCRTSRRNASRRLVPRRPAKGLAFTSLPSGG